MKNFTDLVVWQRAMVLVEQVYRATERFPRHELFGLSAQVRRAAVAIPSNVAEGQGRITAGEWLQFLGNARGSLYELNTQLFLAERLAYLSADEMHALRKHVSGVGRSLSGLIEYVRRRAERRKPPATNN